jgi:hypothetical protein
MAKRKTERISANMQDSKQPKVADKPHSLTLRVAWTGVIISMASIIFAGFTFLELKRNNSINRRPYVEALVSVHESVKAKLRSLPYDTVVDIPLTTTITNHGNSIISDIVFEYKLTLDGVDIGNARAQMTATNNKTGKRMPITIDPHEMMGYPVSVRISAGRFLDALKSQADLSVCTLVTYRDVEGDLYNKTRCSYLADEPNVVVVR